MWGPALVWGSGPRGQGTVCLLPCAAAPGRGPPAGRGRRPLECRPQLGMWWRSRRPPGTVPFPTGPHLRHTRAPPLCVVPAVTPGSGPPAPRGGRESASRPSYVSCAHGVALSVGCCGGGLHPGGRTHPPHQRADDLIFTKLLSRPSAQLPSSEGRISPGQLARGGPAMSSGKPPPLDLASAFHSGGRRVPEPGRGLSPGPSAPTFVGNLSRTPCLR